MQYDEELITNPAEVEVILRRLINRGDVWVRCHINYDAEDDFVWIRPTSFKGTGMNRQVRYHYIDEYFLYEPPTDPDEYSTIFLEDYESWNYLDNIEIPQPVEVLTAQEVFEYIGQEPFI